MIANLLSVPVLESAGYIVSPHKKRDWVVLATKGKQFFVKRETGVCKGMSYSDLYTKKAGLAMIETVRKNLSLTQKNKLRKLSCLAQHRA